MTVEPLVDVVTGEIIDVEMTPAEARDLTDRIRQTLHVGHDLIVQAFKGQAWSVLGYATWDAYCAGEFAGARMVRFDREQTRELVTEMRAARMSVPAVASALGISERTVQRNSPAQVVTPDTTSEPVQGIDGKTYQPPAPRPQAAPEPVQRQTRRAALPESFRRAVHELDKATERVLRLAADDRFSQNREQVAAIARGDLTRVTEALAGVLDQINN